jgi:hypothetical protein
LFPPTRRSKNLFRARAAFGCPRFFVFVKPEEIAPILVSMGCPQEKSLEMASQLDKRARQLVEEKGRTYEEALAHLLSLMKQGWAAKEKGWT